MLTKHTHVNVGLMLESSPYVDAVDHTVLKNNNNRDVDRTKIHREPQFLKSTTPDSGIKF